MRSLRKAYEGELVSAGDDESWEVRWGHVPDIARGYWLSQSLGAELMDVHKRTGMPPFCAINGVFTSCMIFLLLLCQWSWHLGTFANNFN